MSTFCNYGRKWYIFSAPKKIFYAIPVDTKIDESVTKKIFPDVTISCETCHCWVFSYDGTMFACLT